MNIKVAQPVVHHIYETEKTYEPQVRCPKCGSTQITANKKGFNIGHALVGGVLTGGDWTCCWFVGEQ
ncbi:hypothetical protein A2T98_08410 [Nodularia spumigena CENA596]|uniref:LITAF domain-containing protein n=1 Tax=Nodularia spumigena CENA596 TaxID=1819295 RepID=A0A161UW64_NODSP|nr:hypothetical protein A2T98_08410 [Nodularia spumigena CENA596]